MTGLKYAWDMQVAPKYSSATNMEFIPLYNWQSIEYAEAEMVEKSIGKIVYVTRWVQLNDLNFNIIYWSAKDKFVHVLYQC